MPRPPAILERTALLLFFLILIVIFTIMLPNVFLTRSTALVIITAQVAPLLLALGATITLRTHDLDVSFGANMITSGAITGLLLTHQHFSLWPAILCGIGFGALVGLANGILVVIFSLSGFIATLGTMSVVEGIGLGLTNSQQLTGFPPSLTNFMQNGPGNIPKGAIIGWIAFVLLWIVFEYTPFGRYQLFIGGNRTAAELLGLRVRIVRMSSYVISGVIFGGTGIVLMGMLDVVDPTSTGNYLLTPLAAVFLGTTVFQIGRFNAAGTLLGTYVLAVISTGLQLLGASGWVGDVFQGLALAAALLLARLVGSRAADFKI